MAAPEPNRRGEEGPSRRALVVAFVVVAALAVVGVLVAKGLVDMSRLQDCAITGRSDC